MDERPDFEALLAQLENAASSLEQTAKKDEQEGAGFLLEDPNDWLPDGELLDEAPPSLMDFRALSLDEPFSHPYLTSATDDSLLIDLDRGAVVDNKYEVLQPAPDTTNGWEVRHVVLRQRFLLQPLVHSIVDDPVIWPKFQRDIRTAGMLGHENIEFVTDLGRCDQHGPYIVKQWIEGPTLEDWLDESGKQPAQVAVNFAHCVGEALAALHEIGVIHGRLAPRTVRRVEGETVVWKLLDVCIPGGDEVLLAPEQQRGEGTGPEADQYALAYLTLQLLTGGGTDLEKVDVPDAMREVLERALDQSSFARWADIDQFVAELSRAAPAEEAPKPTIHPFDRREASRVVEQELGRDPSVVAEEPIDTSMTIEVTPGPPPKMSVVFNTGARLRRAYRRNMLAGGLFAPTSHALTVGSRLDVSLVFKPRDRSVAFEGLVVTHDPGGPDRPKGYGIAFDVAARRKIEEFVRGLELGLGISPDDEIVVQKGLDASAQIDAGAAFLLSRIMPRMKVGAAKAMFSGLPYDFDDCLGQLYEASYVQVVPAKAQVQAPKRPVRHTPQPSRAPAMTPSPSPVPEPKPQPKPKPAPAPAPKPARKARPEKLAPDEWRNLDRVLETVAFFEEQGNFMAAGRTLEDAVKHAPDVGAYHHRLAVLRAKFDMDLPMAIEHIRIATELEPRNTEFEASRRYIATLVEMAALRVICERPKAVRWLRTEPLLHRIWFDEATSIVGVDVRTGSATRSAHQGRGYTVVPENSPEFAALEERGNVPGSARERHLRQIEIAKRFGKFGPHCAREPIGAARTGNSVLTAHTEKGLTIKRDGVQLAQLSSQPIEEPLFSPNDKSVAWLEKRGLKWAVMVGAITGGSSERMIVDAKPRMMWTDDSSGLLVLDRKHSTLSMVDRRLGEPKELVDLQMCVDAELIPSADDDSVFVVARKIVGEKRWFGVWYDTKTNERRGEFPLPEGAKHGVICSTGLLALVLRDNRLLVADLRRKRTKILGVDIIPESVVSSRWIEGAPLIAVEKTAGGLRALAIDVALICA